MKFGPVSLETAEGKILGHNVIGDDGRRVLRKGRPLTAADLAQLRALGRRTVYVAALEAGDIDENTAAARLAAAVAGPHVRLSAATTGRCNLHAAVRGVLRVAVEPMGRLNAFPGVTLATLAGNTAVAADKMVGTLKILPYAVPETVVHQAEELAAPGLVHVDPLPDRSVGLILSGSPAARERVTRSFVRALDARLAPLGAALASVDFISLDDEAGEIGLAQMLQQRIQAGRDLIILAGETAIMDRHDIAPRAVERAGGEVACYGAPVDPGNLLLLAYFGQVPILGAPGCARSPRYNIVDVVLPRLLVGDRLSLADIVALGHGGLLEDVSERPLPRSRLD